VAVNSVDKLQFFL